mgnify:CR=1 FL=1
MENQFAHTVIVKRKKHYKVKSLMENLKDYINVNDVRKDLRLLLVQCLKVVMYHLKKMVLCIVYILSP